MRIIARALIVSAGVVGGLGSALAADMTGAEIKTFISGQTAYVETTADSSTGKGGPGSNLLGLGWHSPLQDPDGRYVARQVGNQRQYAMSQLERETERSMRAL